MNDRTREILDLIEQDERQLRVGQRLPAEGLIPWETIKRVREDLAYVLQQPGVTIPKLRDALGEGYSTKLISRFRYCSKPEAFPGDLEQATRDINRFIEMIARRAQAKLPSGFIETEVARRILVVVSKTIELASIGVIYADAGRGKTMTLQAAAAINPGSVLLRVRRQTRTSAGLIKALAAEIGLRGVQTSYLASSRFLEAMRETGRCIIIDEAHQLTHDALELVRDIHDEAGLPIVLAGTIRLQESVDDAGAFFAQMSSRIALRYNVVEDLVAGGGPGGKPLHSVDEIKALYESDKVRLTADGRALLTRIANLPGLGGLRMCGKIVQVAGSASGGEAIDARLILKVIRTMNDRAFSEQTVEAAIQREARRAIA